MLRAAVEDTFALSVTVCPLPPNVPATLRRSTPVALTEMAPEVGSALVVESVSVPALTVVPPVYVFVPERVEEPEIMRLPLVPEKLPELVPAPTVKALAPRLIVPVLVTVVADSLPPNVRVAPLATVRALALPSRPAPPEVISVPALTVVVPV